ncbi:hypothetical protein VTJ04DRAFT_3731 [Mycothermus thermophilus]|uniref:uncharacterized protein n=1 Tax=Humicola insolens TaxID=85995 RepID=UPI0037426F67
MINCKHSTFSGILSTVCVNADVANEGRCDPVRPGTLCCSDAGWGECETYLWLGPATSTMIMFRCAPAHKVYLMLTTPWAGTELVDSIATTHEDQVAAADETLSSDAQATTPTTTDNEKTTNVVYQTTSDAQSTSTTVEPTATSGSQTPGEPGQTQDDGLNLGGRIGIGLPHPSPNVQTRQSKVQCSLKFMVLVVSHKKGYKKPATSRHRSNHHHHHRRPTQNTYIQSNPNIYPHESGNRIIVILK